jgi:mRNA-degrading endonuclease RelE of RelBE toxin-antitoxin system
MKFSRHAERQLKERNIKPELVQETLENPEQVVAAGKNRKIAQRTYRRQGSDFLLRVVYSEKDEPEIVTMYWTSKVSKYRRKS